MLKLRLDSVYKQISTCHHCPLGQVVEGRPACGHDGKEIRFFDPAYVCPKGFWRHETIYMIGISPPEDGRVKAPVQVSLDPERAKARGFWESLYDLAGNAKQMAQVMASGEAKPEVIAARKASCEACPARKGPDGRAIAAGVPVGENQWCGDCGCGTKHWARLDAKLTYAYLPCPRRHAGFSNAKES